MRKISCEGVFGIGEGLFFEEDTPIKRPIDWGVGKLFRLGS